MPADDEFLILVNHGDQGKRLDVVVASNLPACSRSRAAQLIAGHHVVIDGLRKISARKVDGAATAA